MAMGPSKLLNLDSQSLLPMAPSCNASHMSCRLCALKNSMHRWRLRCVARGQSIA